MVGIYGAYDVTWAYHFFSIFGLPLLSITIIFFNSMDLLFKKIVKVDLLDWLHGSPACFLYAFGL